MALARDTQPDPRYGYPIRVTYDGVTYSAYYICERSSDLKGYVFVSGDQALIDKVSAAMNEPDLHEVQGSLPNLDAIEFLDPPPVGEPPTKIEFKNRHVFINGENIEYQIEQVCGRLAPFRTDVNLVTHPQTNQVFIDLTCTFTTSGQLAHILIMNELKRMGILDMTTVRIEWSPEGRFSGFKQY